MKYMIQAMKKISLDGYNLKDNQLLNDFVHCTKGSKTFSYFVNYIGYIHHNQPGSGAPNDNFRKNICSEDDFRSRIFGTFVVKFLACLPLLGFSNI